MDPAFTHQSLHQVVRRIDFLIHPQLKDSATLDAEISSAVDALRHPDYLLAEIAYEMRAGKPVARTTSYRTKLALRKLDANLRFVFKKRPDNRELIVRALRTLLSEAVGYRVYKLDVRKFFESFEVKEVVQHLKDRHVTGPVCRAIECILANHKAKSYSGLPRGLSISSTLTEIMMDEFDSYVLRHCDVFFYRRYVDDLTLVTSAREDALKFIRDLEKNLPSGLRFKETKKYELAVKSFRKTKASNVPVHRSFDYLGYEFNVTIDGHQPNNLAVREVWLDIAKTKVSKIKTRLVACFRDYLVNKDYHLLEKRIKHLTSNLSMLDRSKGIRRLVGIHFNYPQVDITKSKGLHELDWFLKNALSSRKGRVYSRLYHELSSPQKQTLAKYSFYRGARDRKFYQLNLQELGRIQRCWKHGH